MVNCSIETDCEMPNNGATIEQGMRMTAGGKVENCGKLLTAEEMCVRIKNLQNENVFSQYLIHVIMYMTLFIYSRS